MGSSIHTSLLLRVMRSRTLSELSSPGQRRMRLTWRRVSPALSESPRLSLASAPEAKAGSALAKVAPVAKVLTGTAFGAKGVHDIYTAGTDNSPEAWQQRLQGAAELTGGATLAGEPIAESGIVGKAAGTAGRVVDDAKNVV